MKTGTIALLTDYGTKDWFVGSIKGVIRTINPEATIDDITHELPMGDVRSGAFMLLCCYRTFPKDTVFIVVVDPGVGSNRPNIVAKAGDYFFVGPDNGILSLVLRLEDSVSVHLLENSRYFRKPVSSTFHGRDIFAPVGAHISKGVMPRSFGPKAAGFMSFPFPEVKSSGSSVFGEIIYIDHFGNCITNIDEETLRNLPADIKAVSARFFKEIPFREYYQQAPSGEPLALLGSSGFLEIAVNSGSAAHKLGLKVGDPVELLLKG